MTWLLIALPLAGAVVLLIGGRATDAWGHLLGCATALASFVVGAMLFIDLVGRPAGDRTMQQTLFSWVPAGELQVDFGLQLDQLSICFVLLITGVGSLIHLYSIGYMAPGATLAERPDNTAPGRRNFFGYLNLFLAAMLLLVLADNYLGLYMGWEGVGLASYLLIGFWSHKPSAATAAKKAFVVNRVGDMGLAVALMVMFAATGTVSFAGVFGAAPLLSEGSLNAIGLLLLLAACGKSAQLPLQSWLGDAMEGPTPVSALIHAATMVTAGVYLIVRSGPVFNLAPDAQLAVAVVGAATLLFGAIIGCAKDDIKKALAASTMSQIGYMVLAAGLGPAGYALAIMHLLTHGFFKAGLFLGAGSVMHGMNDETDIRRFGGLRTVMPITFVTFGLGYLAIIGVPPFAGFFSKDPIIETAFAAGGVRGLLLGGAALLGAGITAFYMTRVMLLTFFGERRWGGAAQHPHESPAIMTAPMIVLAIGSVGAGALLAVGGRLVSWLEPVVNPAGTHLHHAIPVWVMTIVTLSVVAVGVGVAYRMYATRPVPLTAPAGSGLTVAARDDLYGDAFNERVFMRPGQKLTAGLVGVDDDTIDGAARGLAALIAGTSRWMRRWQTGFARSYALLMLGGTVLVIVAILLVGVWWNGIGWLTALWTVPMVGAAVIILLPAAARDLAKYAALAVSLVVLALAAVVAVRFDPAGPQFQFVEDYQWIPSFGTGYILGLDGIALALVVLTAVLVPLLIVAGWNDGAGASEATGDKHGESGSRFAARSTHSYLALMLAIEAMVLVSLMALDVLLFYVFFEAMLIPLYFLIGGFGGANRSGAAVKFLLYNLFGGLIMLAAVIGLYVVTAGSDAFESGTFDFRAIVSAVANGELNVDPALMNALFLGFMFAFAIKAPLWPFHRWLPDAAVESTPATAVLMMAVVDKVGTFGMLRYCLQLFPDASKTFQPLIITLAVVGIVYGAILAIGQTDVMRLIAYTSISHFGFIILGIFAMTSQGQSGSTLYMVNHGISTAALFLIAGFLVTRRGTRLIADFGGVQKVAPVLAGTFLVAGLATLSLPGLAPFISEFLVFIGTFTRFPVVAVFAASALVLSAVYVLWAYQRMMTGPVTDGNESLRDLVPRELIVVTPLIALLLVLGVYPKPVLDVIDPAVTHTLTTIDVEDPVPTVAEGQPK